MKKLLGRFVTVLIVIAMAITAALAEKKKDTVMLDKDTLVNGTLLKAGTYKAQFDFKTDTLSIMKWDGMVVATAPGKLEPRPNRAAQTQVVTDLAGNDQVLASITFSGDNRTIVIAGAEARPAAGAR